MADGYLNTPENSPGIMIGASPDWQIKQQQIAATDTFRNGLPTDPSGNIDYSAAARALLQKGAFEPAKELLALGQQQQAIRLGLDSANQLEGGGTGAPPVIYGAQPVTGAPQSTAKGANPAVVGYIQKRASDLGINPNVALAVANSEGLRGFDPAGNANLGDGGSSGGPFQLHYGGVAGGPNAGAGLGDDFTKATGLDARDPSTWQAQVDFALQHAAKNGWGAFHGAAKTGIAPFAGIGGQSAQPQVAQAPGNQAPVQVAQNTAPVPGATATDASSLPVPPVKPASMGGAPSADDSASDASSSAHPYAYTGNGPSAGTPDPNAAPPVPVQVAGPGAPTQVAPPAQAGYGAPPQTSSSVIDPTLGGLLKGQWVGNPGGYVSALRAQAVRLATIGNTAAAGAYNKQADAVERGIERNNIVTNEMKNYSVAVGQGYQGTMMQFAADGPAQAETAKIIANSTPAALRAKGQQAEAAAAGTAQGQAGYEMVPTQPVPGGPTVLVPKSTLLASNDPVISKQPAFIAQQQEALGKQQNEMLGQYQQRQIAQERLGAMTNLLETFQSGAGADQKASAVAAVRALGINIPDSATANPAAVEQFSKNTTANIFSQAKALGGKVLVSELAGLQKSNANPNMQPASNAAILAQQKGLLDWQDAHDQAFFDWHQQNPNAYDASSFEQQWAKANAPSKYVAAAKLNIAPLGVPLPPKNQLVDGQAYMIKGQKARWSATANGFVPVAGGQ